METNKIKTVAIYLRKSRDETEGKEDVLAKHEALLLEYAKKHQLKYRTYKEIGNSEYIDSRPEMVRLLKDVELDLYDAVLVVDIDRLGRGDDEERGRIKRIFRESNTLVLTPAGRLYDFNNDDQAIVTDIEMVFANYEYRMIKKRMLRGKKQGAKAGKWTNGPAPFPYVYNRLTKELEVDEDKAKTYNLMKCMFLEEMKPAYQIAWELNRLGFKTNRNASWYENAVYRTLTNEVHLGKVVYGKSTGSGHKDKPKAKGVQLKERSEWIVAEGSHQPLKTEEEHKRIVSIFESRRLKPNGSRRNVQVLSKLLLCGKCGRTMSFIDKHNGRVFVKTCMKADQYGNRCGNRGMDAEVVYAQLFFDLKQYERQLLSNNESDNQRDDLALQMALTHKREELTKLEGGIGRIKDLYIDGSIDKAEMKLRIEKVERQIQTKREEIRFLEQSLAMVETDRTTDDRLSAIRKFKEAWHVDNITRKELNTLAKEIIDRIELIRQDDEVQVRIQFL